jgi:hypothetical protein
MWMWILLTALQIVEAGLTYVDGYFFPWQQSSGSGKIGFYTLHPGMWGDIVIVNAVAAWILNSFGETWNTRYFAILFVVVAGLVVPVVMQWAKDSVSVPESLARNGLLPVAGAIHYLRTAFLLSVILYFYLFTPEVSAHKTALHVITLLLVVHTFLGIILPPQFSRGSVPKEAWSVAIGMWTLLIGFWARLALF